MHTPNRKGKTVQLSREAFIDAALLVVAEEGVDKLSMRRVATELGVSPMAMYKHFANKDELLVSALDEFIARAEVLPRGELPWDQYLDYVARAMYQALAAQSSWTPYLGSLGGGQRAAAVSDAVVQKLVHAGFSIADALKAYFTVIQLVIGAVCLRAAVIATQSSTSSPTDAPLAALTCVYLEQVDAGRLQVAPQLDLLMKSEQMDIGLPLVIESLRQRLGRQHAGS
jgi:TetR/AcrR family tetracycline transcriptional repressor